MKKSSKKLAAFVLASSLVFGNSAFVMAEETTSEPIAVTLEAVVSEMGTQMLSALTGEDFSWLKSAKMDINVDIQDTLEAVRLLASLNDSPIMSGIGYVDLSSMMEYFKVNELSEEYLSLNLGELLAPIQDKLGGSIDVQENSGAFPAVAEKLQDPEAYSQLLMKYGMPFATVIEELEETELEVSYAENTAVLSYEGGKVNLGALVDVIIRDLDTLKEDTDTLALINEAVSDGAISEEMIDEGIEYLTEAKETNQLDAMDLEIMYGMSEDGSAMGAYATLVSGEEAMDLAEILTFTTDTGVVGIAYVGPEEANLGVQFEFGETYTVVFTENHEGILQAVLTPAEDGGTLLIAPVVEDENALLADYEDYALEFAVKMKEDGESGDVSVKLVYGEDALLTLTGTAAPGEAMEIPELSEIAASAIDMNDEEAMGAYVENADPTTLLDAFLAAGVPAEFLGVPTELE